MDTSARLLDLLFRRIPPEHIFKQLCDRAISFSRQNHGLVSQEAFLRYAEPALHNYSEDEQTLLFRFLKQVSEEMASKTRTTPSVFYALADFGEKVLVLSDDIPVCKFHHVLKWRGVFHTISQDIVICATLAYRDVLSSTHRNNFAWPATIGTDNSVLDQMLEEGISENHCHLNGSTQSFALSWYKLMNYPDDSSDWLTGFPELLQSVTGRGSDDNVLPIDERVRLAAMARAILFKALHPEDFHSSSDDVAHRNYCMSGSIPFQDDYDKAYELSDHSSDKTPKPLPFTAKDEFCKAYVKRFDSASYTINTTRFLRRCYGMPIPLPDGTTDCMDYALERHIFLPVANSPYRLLAGERYFLYSCFRACFDGTFSDFEQDLLYFYLLVKTVFRGEMIQVNRQVGFQNFSNYEKRKSLIWEDDPYWWEAYRMALNAPLVGGKVTSLESRFCPSATPTALEEKVKQYDKAKWFADLPYSPVPLASDRAFTEQMSSGELHDAPHFYVLHFPKEHDVDFAKCKPFCLQCRHEDLRNKVKQSTIATAEALSNSDYLCGRIRGIDGCANEIDCRPEVFATAFRYLSSLQHTSPPSPLLGSPSSRLSLTYHAGEDFYDITDGLRAIDEATYFLEMKRGDRIGHALALGVDPEIHYRKKYRCVVIPKQNHLDNLVWLLFRGRELNLGIDAQQYGIMQQEALRLIREIYGNAIRENNWSGNLLQYYNSMKLRGDAPELYKTTLYKDPPFTSCGYDQFCISMRHTELDVLRRDPEISGLIYYYHYGHREKVEGAKTMTVSVTPEYVKIVKEAQQAMQFYLEQHGIIIECNPTSNVLIGTFGKYEDHPIFRLNNYGLSSSGIANSNPQMHVCINTDDLGVFDTSLSFEYALLFQALNEMKDDDGNKLYKEVEIIAYLNNIRKMGNTAVFPKSNRE